VTCQLHWNMSIDINVTYAWLYLQEERSAWLNIRK